ncbi:MAG: galactokinase [Ferruginibacter sp.]|nr:galactokinase [Ferruginibacter sp.]
MNTAIARSVSESFTQNFNHPPHLYFSPGRINLIGEHVDYNDGYVMPAAINKGVYYAVAENHTDDIFFYAMDFNEHFSINIHQIKSNQSWKNYVLSVINEFQLLGKNIRGFNCVFAGDIPIGSGMSSSAAVEGGLAFALNEFFKAGLSRVELALLCQRAEHNFPNVQCGIMDQFANMMGKQDYVILLDCRSIEHEYFPLLLAGFKIVLINTKVHHSLASGEYNVRRQRCEEGLTILKGLLPIQSFRDIKNVDELEVGRKSMTAEVYNCCRYVIEEMGRTKKAAELLQANDIAGFGKLMYATHEGLSELYRVSCDELDFLVEQAKKYPAVIGSRLMGGGFGGCTINIVKEEGIDHFIEATTTEYQQRFNIIPEAYLVETADGTSEITLTP